MPGLMTVKTIVRNDVGAETVQEDQVVCEQSCFRTITLAPSFTIGGVTYTVEIEASFDPPLAFHDDEPDDPGYWDRLSE